MNRQLVFAVASLLLLMSPAVAAGEGSAPWKKLADAPRKFQLDRAALARTLALAPREGTEAARGSEVVLELPLPDGTLARFRVLESPILSARMTQEYGIRTYAARGLDDPGATARFDLSPTGFHALVLGTSRSVVIRPDGDAKDQYVSLPYEEDPMQRAVGCATADIGLPKAPDPAPTTTTSSWSDEYSIYRLATAATGEFTAANGGTKASALAAITTTINGVNAIYRRDLGIFLDIMDGTDAVIFTDGATDPYSSGVLTCTNTTWCQSDCLSGQNQCVLDIAFGVNGYDVGIVFDQNNVGGRAPGTTCDAASKGSASTTGTGIQITAHEIGHMFKAHHSFNDGTNGACGNFLGGSQRDPNFAWEPGSGSTIMSYAGSCGAGDLQGSPDLFFHHRNVMDVRDFVAGDGATCADHAFSGNYAPVVQGVTGNATVPAKTPFLLDVNAYDPNNDPVSVSWEEEDTGTASPPETDDGSRPIFRAYAPRSRSSRSYPDDRYVLDFDNNPPATWGGYITGETQTTTNRVLHFGAILRDGADGVTITGTAVTVDASSGPFEITSPVGTSDWTKSTRKTVTWNVAGTNAGPVNCQNVRILLSTDDGDTWPYVLASSTPNDGSETITLPDVYTVSARIKVEAVGNIFYDISQEFTIDTLALKNTNDSGPGSLRQAILDANDWPFGATIPVQIPGPSVQTIHVSSPLPTISKPVSLDAWEMGGDSYFGPPLLEIEGTGCSTANNVACDGLVIQADNTNINGIVVRNFAGNGVVFRGAAAYASALQNSYVGINAAGNAAAGNGQFGVLIDGGYGDPVYGNSLWSNVISGNGVGVKINGASANGTALYGNKIGTNAAGTAAIPNQSDGVFIFGAPNTIVGAPGKGNVISGNGTVIGSSVDGFANGIDINGVTASGTKIQANLIGLDITGKIGIFNTDKGIRVTDAPNTLIGGTAAGTRNVIGDDGTVNYHAAHCIHVANAGATGTVIQGNYIGTDITGTLDRGCRGAGVYVDSAPGVQIGGTTAAARNVISGNNDNGGVWITGTATGTQIQGNYIGTDVTGAVALGNNPFGIHIVSGSNTIGGTAVGAGNVISGNTHAGIDIAEQTTSSNVIQGNLVGTNAAGTAAIGNVTYGISILRSDNNQIGGTVPGARNVISGNGDRGIFVQGSPPSQVSAGTTIQGNYIGTDVTGTAGIGNTIGIELYYVANNTVGGPAPGAGNVISAGRNANTGVRINSFGNSTSGIVIQNNKIGTNAAGTAALGNTGEGIGGNITGTASILGNVVAASGQYGIDLSNGSFTVKGNWIGTDVTGTVDLRNAWSGIYTTSQDPCTIGGTGAGEGNVVAFNATAGTGTNFAGIVVGGAASRQTIRGNRIYSNTGLGIDLLPFTGVSGPDACDSDGGPNGSQNFPVVTSAYQSGSSTHVIGTLNSTASASFTVDFYASPSCDPLGNGEGAVYLGSASVPTNASCAGSFDLIVPAPSSGVVTATTTDALGNTSEFSACRAVGPSPVAEVTGVAWAGKSELTWSAAAGATTYRVLRGTPSDLPHLLDTASDSCSRFSGSALTTGPTLGETPLATTPFYWYLVVGSNGVDDGPYGAATAGPRIANEAGSCP